MKRTKVSLSNYKLFSANMGNLYPIGVQEVLPGDTWQHSTKAMIRVSPLLAPVMHPVSAKIFHFFVPYRLCWENWEKFITGGPDGMDNSAFPTKTFVGPDPGVGTLPDFLGVTPPNGVQVQEVSALPFRAYQLIWNEWIRDQDLDTEATVSLADGADITTSIALRQISWEKDRFTSARPWPQKGDDVSIPFGSDTAPVELVPHTDNTNRMLLRSATTGALSGAAALSSDASGNLYNGTSTLVLDPNERLFTDLSDASGTIRDLREAVAIQRFRDRMARAGSRYTEYLKSSFGVRSSDARLQRPELLGHGSQLLQFSEVLQTAPDIATGTSEDFGVGALKGHGIGTVRSNRYRRFFEEHGVVITLFAVKPKAMYVQGTEKFWWRRTKEDFYDKDLALIGEEPVLNREVWANSADPSATFGWQQRYYDYREALSTIAGEFRTSVADFWHMARSFSSAPTLNASFVHCNPTDRIYAVPSQDELYVMAHHSIQARRPITSNSNARIL